LLSSGEPLAGLLHMAQCYPFGSWHLLPRHHTPKPFAGEATHVMVPFVLHCLCHGNTMTDREDGEKRVAAAG
jgi:hypothetical protein